MTQTEAILIEGGRPTRRGPVIAILFAVGAVLIVGSVISAAGGRDGRGETGEPVSAAAETPLARLEAKVVDAPDDAASWAALGAAYVDHARANSDPSAYPKAERALDRSLALQGEGNWQALAAKGALAAGRHDFAPALEFSQQARALQPHSSFILGVIVDSLTELGRYPEAVDASQAMVDLRPDLSSYARVSYQRELHGDVDGAVAAMESARQAASTAGDKAFALYYLGQLEWNRGNIDRAAEHYETALRTDPSAAQARAGIAKVAAARGDIASAIANYEKAVAAFPDPEALKELGELLLVQGDTERAEERFREAATSNADQASGGVYVDLETALFSADHNRDLAEGMAAARREWSRRQSVHVADALAWQLFRHGSFDEALIYADKALALGMRNAAFHFHRAEIHHALGNHDAARADYEQVAAINPNFSFLHREQARQRLAAASAA